MTSAPKRRSLKSAFTSAALALVLGGYAAYSHIADDKPNPMAILFAGIFGALSGSAFKQYRDESKPATPSPTQPPKP